MIAKARAGRRLFPTLKDHELLRNDLRGSKLTTSTPGMSVANTAQGGVVTYLDPKRTMWVYVVGTTSDGFILAKEAIPVPGGDIIYQGVPNEEDNHLIVSMPAPGYKPEHFEHFTIEGVQPIETDRACIIEGGRIRPDFRMLLVDPVAIEELCEPCEEPQ